MITLTKAYAAAKAMHDASGIDMETAFVALDLAFAGGTPTAVDVARQAEPSVLPMSEEEFEYMLPLLFAAAGHLADQAPDGLFDTYTLVAKLKSDAAMMTTGQLVRLGNILRTSITFEQVKTPGGCYASRTHNYRAYAVFRRRPLRLAAE